MPLSPAASSPDIQMLLYRASYLFIVLHAGLCRQHIYSQQLLTVSVTFLHRLHLGSYQSHHSNDLVLSACFCAAIIELSFELHFLSLCCTCFAVVRAPSYAFPFLLTSQQVIICKESGGLLEPQLKIQSSCEKPKATPSQSPS